MQLKFAFPPHRNDSFENFVVDGNNEKAALICNHFTGKNQDRPASLVITGPPGSGKTHLLTAMGKEASAQSGSSSLYLDGADLVEKVGGSGTYEELKIRLASFESASFLAIDRLEIIEGAKESEDQVFHLYNAVTQAGGRFAAALRTPPSKWRFADWLATRLLWGHVVTLGPVGDDRKVEVLQKMASDLRLTLPRREANWMLTHLDRDPKSQLKALSLIDQRSLTTGKKVSIPLIKKALEHTDAG